MGSDGMRILILLFSTFIISFLPIPATDLQKVKKSKLIYESILKNGWLEEKRELGYKLGKMGEEAEPFILKLYDAESYWDRYAAITASSIYKSDKINERLVDSYLRDHMVEVESEQLLLSQTDSYTATLLEKWDTELREEPKKKILRLLAISKDPRAKEFIKAEIEDQKSKYRSSAFQWFCSKNDIKDNDYIRSKLADKVLRSFVLKYILETGDKKDKKLMLDVLSEESIGNTDFTYALGGVKKWGNFQEQESEYTKTLQNTKHEESLKLYAILLFGEFRSEAIRDSLCGLAKNARDQSLRLTASEVLIPFQDVKNIECLKRISTEEYQTASKGFGFVDAVAMFATLGISNIMKGIQENRSRSSFLGRQTEIKKHLQFLELKIKE